MTTNDILVVPDVHGRTFWRNVINSDLPVVFLGDYTDPYYQEGITNQQALEEFKDIISLAKENPDRITLLLGNHMLHYVGLSPDSCRFDIYNWEEIYKLLVDNKQLFSNGFLWDNTIFTHAGITIPWLRKNDLENTSIEKVLNVINTFEFSDEFIKAPNYYMDCFDHPITQIGQSRGGTYLSGSPAWADLIDVRSNPAFTEQYIQIFGHTLKDIVIHEKNYYMCDCKKTFLWNGYDLTEYK